MHVIGTAGHVDHGKSTLVRALTGIDPDRLKEEKARQMTIDLGFAWLTLPDGDLIGVIDVPGHRDFIENMLAGVGGIHAALFVIAADEGVMPQTREHLAILDLLKIPTGVIALTKTDLAPDSDWLELVQLDVLNAVGGTVLDNVPLIPVSARDGIGLDALKAALMQQLATIPPTLDIGKPRLWVDRVFSVSGFGTVVTGTLLDGTLTLGQEVQLQPGAVEARIRGLQTHNQTIETAQPGSRVAVNLAGVEKRAARRGQLLTLPGLIEPSKLVSVRFRHLPDASRPLRHNSETKFFCGSAETLARVRLLDSETLAPGQTGWLQLELDDPLPLIHGDRFILRYPSPAETIGGGDVVQTGIAPRYRRNRLEVVERLEVLSRAAPDELVIKELEISVHPLTIQQIIQQTSLSREAVVGVLAQAAEQATQIGEFWIAPAVLSTLVDRLMRILSGFHKAEPLRTGIRVENLRHQLGLDQAQLNALLDYAVQQGLVVRTAIGTAARTDFTVQPTKVQQATIERLLADFAQAPYTPPSYKEAAAQIGEDVLAALLEWGELVRVSPEVLLTPAALGDFAAETRRALAEEGQITIKALRDRFNTSRKYAQAVLEYFDSLGLTRRKGDDHVMGAGDWSKIKTGG